MDISGDTILPAEEQQQPLLPTDLTADLLTLLFADTTTTENPATLLTPTFSIGVAPLRPLVRRRPRPQARNTTDISGAAAPVTWNPMTWEQRQQIPPQPDMIRLLEDPPADAPQHIANLWYADRTLTAWHEIKDASSTPFELAIYGPSYRDDIADVFYRNQRRRWLARWTLQRWRLAVWRKRTVCNVDMIDMQPIADADAVFVTDTANRCIYRFHRRDMYTNLLSNICMADDMLPCPRPPTNPWTNQPLTLVQTMSVCQQLVADYARRGRCPPPLFAAFWAARFDLRQFEQENSAVLAQHAITTYFKDLTDDTHATVFDTMTSLLAETGCEFMPQAVRRWLRASPQTASHREWLAMVRDYTLYMNLHIQARPHWYTRDHIYGDVMRLFQRTEFPDTTSQRMRQLRAVTTTPVLAGGSSPLSAFLGLSLLGTPPTDISGNMDYNVALQLIQQALFRM